MVLRSSARSLFKLDYEKELNPQQLAVVKADKGPVLVIAGAGSGKTRVVTYRVAYLMETGVDPSRILLVTFTNKAAREMLERVERLVPTGEGVRGRVWGGTFHHIGNRILRRHAPLVGFQPNFTILDQDDAKNLMDLCIKELKINPKGSRFPKGEVLEDILGLVVNTRRPLPEVTLDRYPFFYDMVDDFQAVVKKYRQRKQQLNAMDFDDLLFYWELLLRDHPEVRARYGDQFQHILVDEYQDTNHLQGDIVDLMAERHGNVMVVGDDSQSIYSFRGANFENIIKFPERHPSARVFKLEINYRSTPADPRFGQYGHRVQPLAVSQGIAHLPLCRAAAEPDSGSGCFGAGGFRGIEDFRDPPTRGPLFSDGGPISSPLSFHGTPNGADEAGRSFRGPLGTAVF